MTNKIGKFISELRDQEGLTQTIVADRIGHSRVWVSRLERGLASPSLEDLYSLSRALDMEVIPFFLRLLEIGDPSLKRTVDYLLISYEIDREMRGNAYGLGKSLSAEDDT